MYPENSLMRTHSLGNIKNENQQQTEKGFAQDLDQTLLVPDNRKPSEKKWHETLLHNTNVDSGPVPVYDIPPPMKRHTPPIIPQSENKNLHSFEQPENQFDAVIIFKQFFFHIINIIYCTCNRFHLNRLKIILLFKLENGNHIVKLLSRLKCLIFISIVQGLKNHLEILILHLQYLRKLFKMLYQRHKIKEFINH